MAQVKLTLRPPPNVDFVQGFPGIPPAVDRQQACIQGQVEVRVGAPNVKAKYIRVELRKVETLPGGGQANTFYDIVGSEPASLWASGEEYGVLQNQDFPFTIRLPESLPPSITLENRAGVQYELVASVSTKGKKSWFRSRKPVVQACSAPITIDKHDLHSTWPVYCQNDSRQVTHDGVTLIIERSNSCFGPGDRLSVLAVVKSDSMHTVILRGFEYSLREVIDFRGAPAGKGSKKANEQRKIGVLDEGRLPVNATLYGGTQHRAELVLNISPKHSTTTLTSARHIDINYMLSVRGILGSGTHLTMDIPVIVSNWPRTVSEEAIRRIGIAPNLSLTQPGAHPTASAPQQAGQSSTFSGRSVTASPPQAFPNKTMPNSHGRQGSTGADELGGKPTSSSSREASSSFSASGSGSRTLSMSKGRPRSRGDPNGNRLAIASALDKEMAESPPKPRSVPSTPPAWPAAEEEKKKLYESARAKVERVQGIASPNGHANASSSSPPHTSVTPPKPASGGTSRNSPWPTSEQEKARLFEKARATAHRNQSDVLQSLSNSDLRAAASGSSSTLTHARSASGSGLAPPSASPSSGIMDSSKLRKSPRSFLSAEDEKAALRRYEEAKRAVDRTQGQQLATNPREAGESSSLRRGLSVTNPNENGDELPSFADSQPSVGIMSGSLTEKERIKRQYAARDAEASIPPYSPGMNAGSFSLIGDAVSEKERLRRRYDSQDVSSPPKAPPPRPGTGSRPPPPVPADGGKVLSAMEEKALLRACFESEDTQHPQSFATSSGPPYNNGSTYTDGALVTSSPPPLAPRPPADYIKETQEEDARVAQVVAKDTISLHDGESVVNGAMPPPPLPPKPVEP
jgi:hypothetical protein